MTIRYSVRRDAPTPALREPGEVVWAKILQGSAAGKFRPACVVTRESGHFLAMGFTTLTTYENGEARISIPNPAAVGLRGQGYLWSGALVRVDAADGVGDHIGWADRDLAEAIIALARLHGRWAHGLRLAAHDHHDDLGIGA